MFDFKNNSSGAKRAIFAVIAGCIVLVAVTIFVGVKYAINTLQSNKQYSSALNETLETYHMADNPQEKYPSAINLAQLYIQRQDYQNAVKYLVAANEHSGGNDPNIHMAVADSAQKLGNKDLAIDHLEKATAAYQQQLPDEAYKLVKSSNDEAIKRLLGQ